mmetsp:Transcript_9950/g.33033  ORF Transcript_9950/g.33033 Transcript_9950/m.33033 type:complete len:252 (-) Transcript_9950:645-1400(-)
MSWRTMSSCPSITARRNAVVPSFAVALSAKPVCDSNLAAPTVPYVAASCRGVWPFLETASKRPVPRAASRATRICSTFSEPYAAATCSAVCPLSFRASICASDSRSSWATSGEPPTAAARCSGEAPASLATEVEAPRESKSLTTATFPYCTARLSGVIPAMSSSSDPGWLATLPVRASMSAPMSSNALTARALPLTAARCRGDSPLLDRTLTSAPATCSSRTMLAEPLSSCMTRRCSGVAPSLSRSSTLAP